LLALAGCCCPPDDGESAANGPRALFDGETLEGWERCNYAGNGEIGPVGDGVLRIGRGEMLSGIRYTGETPRVNYEVVMEARRVEGDDFFYCLTFPFKDKYASFVVGGWGGAVCGISSIDFMDAMENMTMSASEFVEGRWYRIRLLVTDHRLQGFIDGERIFNANLEGRQLGMRFGEIEESLPFGLSTFSTTGEYREMSIRALDEGEIAAALALDDEDEF